MYPSIPALALFFTSLSPRLVYAFYPNWQYAINFKGQLYCARASNRATSQLVVSQVPSNQIWQITALCRNSNGGLVNPDECHHSVITTGAAFGLSVLYWKQNSYWAGANGPRNVRRSAFSSSSTAQTDDFLSRIPDHIPISNIKVNNAPLPANTTSPTHRRLKRDADEYSVFYNGSLPLTFIIHHQVNSPLITRDSTPEEIPLFAATDGQNMYLTHIVPLNSTTASTLPLPAHLTKRSGWNGYNYVGTGGLKLQTMSDPVANWGDAMGWIDGGSEQGGISPYAVFLYQAQYAGWLGHSFLDFVIDKRTGKGYNGQWAMVAETSSFGTDWDPNWNWCFGVYPQNC